MGPLSLSIKSQIRNIDDIKSILKKSISSSKASSKNKMTKKPKITLKQFNDVEIQCNIPSKPLTLPEKTNQLRKKLDDLKC